MVGRIIEAIILLLGVLVAAFFVVTIPNKSYNEYKDYLAQIEQQNEENKQAQIKPVLESITVTLKDGVRYFANDMAEAKAEDFIVVANYTKGEEAYSEPVEEGKFSVKTPSDFYSNGGNVTVTYRNVSENIKIELEPVLLESISVRVTPYTIKYAVGSTFDAAGMIIDAVYNDGSSKVLSSDEYVVDMQTALSASDTKVTVSYTDGEIVKTVDVAIGVSESLNNGAVESIVIVDKAVVYSGDYITNASMEVNAVYESGNRVLLNEEEYTITGSSAALEFGKKYQITVSYKDDPSKSVTKDVVVRQTVQGESGVVVGGKVLTETEYVIIDGVITETENKVSFAGSFSKAVLNGEEASLTLTINSAAATVGNITMRCSNSYNVYANGSDTSGGYMMKPLQINTILDLTINGKEVKVPATVILKGCGPHEKYAPLYGIYYEFTFEDVELDAGINNIRFNFKKSTVGASNCWGESPSTLNIDYVNFDTLGGEIPEDYTIQAIEISNELTIKYAQSFDSLDVSVIATIDNGSKIGLSPDLVDIEIIGGEAGDQIFKFGTYTIKATLKTNPAITATKEIVIEEYEKFTVLHAGVEIIDGRVYYVFSGDSIGYAAEDLEFFDGANVYNIIVEFDATTFTLKIDVTDLAPTTIYPHLNVGGSKYENGANANGDIRGNGLTYTNGQSVILNGKSYTINTEWSMPTLVIEEKAPVNPDPDTPVDPTEIYDAKLDVNFESDKTFVDKLVHGSDGVSTNGTNQNSQFAGGIGGIDQIERYVKYSITFEQDGYIDIVWYIAANWWKNSTNNDVSNIAENIVLTIGGKSVDIDGIGLVKGTTDDTLWWNVKPIVVTNIPVKAGETLEIYAECITKGKGINVGSLEYYFATTESDYSEPEIIYDYKANIDNSFASDKTLIGKYSYGSDGVSTNGSNKNNEFEGGIGGMDKLDKYVTYTFNVDTDGKVDFIWNIAGSNWNSSTNSNNGLADAGQHLVVIIDDKIVDFNGLALPAGDGTNTSTWWNVQQVVIKDVELSAGTHTFSCVIITDGAGLNVGSMEIYFEGN